VQGISDLITMPGEINVDFADVRTIMTRMGIALMGTGVARGEGRAIEAAQRAVSSPLLEETSIHGARGLLINISGGYDLTLHEVAEAARIISDAVDPEANIISGMVIDPSLEDTMKVTVIATGFHREGELPRAQAPSYSSAPMVSSRAEAERPGDTPLRRAPAAPQPAGDSNGFGPNWSNVDDYDIPTVLRKQMD